MTIDVSSIRRCIDAFTPILRKSVLGLVSTRCDIYVFLYTDKVNLSTLSLCPEVLPGFYCIGLYFLDCDICLSGPEGETEIEVEIKENLEAEKKRFLSYYLSCRNNRPGKPATCTIY